MTKHLRLEDIAFAETLGAEPDAPPVRDLAADTHDRRLSARLHWLRHTKDGVLNALAHHVLKHCPCGLVSGFGHVLVPMMRWSYRDKIFPKRIRRNFSALTPGRWPNREAEARALDRYWRNIARTISEFCVVNRLWKSSRIEVEGLEHLEAVRKSGRPVLFTSMHLATWEALFVAIHEASPAQASAPSSRSRTASRTGSSTLSARKETSFCFRPANAVPTGCTD